MRTVAKTISVIFLLLIALYLWIAIHDWMQLDLLAEPPSIAQAERDLDTCAGALEEGSVPDCVKQRWNQRGGAFDSFLIISYLIPLGLAWLLGQLARAREISPLSILVAIELPCLLVLLAGAVISQIIAAYWFLVGLNPSDHMITSDFGYLFMPLVDWAMEMVMVLMAGLIFAAVLVVYALPTSARGILVAGIAWLIFVPRQIDRFLRFYFGSRTGRWRQRHGLRSAHVAGAMVAAAVVLPAGLGFWWLCDLLDGYGSSQIALLVRGAVTAVSLVFLLRAHLPTLRA